MEQTPENDFFSYKLFQHISCSVLILLNAGHKHVTNVPAP